MTKTIHIMIQKFIRAEGRTSVRVIGRMFVRVMGRASVRVVGLTFFRAVVQESKLLLLGGVIVVAACQQQEPEALKEEQMPVETVEVVSRELVQPIRTSGKVSSKTESKLSFKTGGIIQRIYVVEGQVVEKGELLARLNLEEIKSQVNQAELAYEKAQRDFRRAENLFRDSVVTLEQYQDARTGLEVAEENLDIARFNLEFSRIRAPTKGKILKKLAEENEIVGPGYPVLYFASTASDWVMRVNLTDKDIVRVRLLDSGSVFFDAYPGESFRCIVSETGTVADPYTGTYEVELLLIEEPPRLVSGFIGRVHIYQDERQELPVIPVEALVNGTGMNATVYVMEKEVPVKRRIRIHAITDDGVFVQSGIDEGERVVVEGVR